MPQRRVLHYTRRLSAAELINVRKGHLPRDMDDKWFCFAEDDRLYIHRSWTGHAVFEAQLRTLPGENAEVWELCRNADRGPFNRDDEAAAALFDRLLTRLASQTM